MIETIRDEFVAAANRIPDYLGLWAYTQPPKSVTGNRFVSFKFDELPSEKDGRLRTATVNRDSPDTLILEIQTYQDDRRYTVRINGQAYSTDSASGDTANDVYERIRSQIKAPLLSSIEDDGTLHITATAPGDVLSWSVSPGALWETPIAQDTHRVKARVGILSSVVDISTYSNLLDPATGAGIDAAQVKKELRAIDSDLIGIQKLTTTLDISEIAGPDFETRAFFQAIVNVLDIGHAEIVEYIDTVNTTIQGRDPDNSFSSTSEVL